MTGRDRKLSSTQRLQPNLHLHPTLAPARQEATSLIYSRIASKTRLAFPSLWINQAFLPLRQFVPVKLFALPLHSFQLTGNPMFRNRFLNIEIFLKIEVFGYLSVAFELLGMFIWCNVKILDFLNLIRMICDKSILILIVTARNISFFHKY